MDIVEKLIRALLREEEGCNERQVGTRDELQQKIENLKSGDYIDAFRAAQELMLIGKPAIPALVEGLRDENHDVRCLAAEALERIDVVAALSALIEALGDENADVRGSAVWRLEDLVMQADTIEKAEKIEVMLQEASAALAKKGRNIEAMMGIAKVMKQVSDTKNELAPKRDMLLDSKPKPPKRGKVYQAARRVRNG